jgi:hypothetical protein
MMCRGGTDTWAWKWRTNDDDDDNDDNLESWGEYLRQVSLIDITIAGDEITAHKEGSTLRYSDEL